MISSFRARQVRSLIRGQQRDALPDGEVGFEPAGQCVLDVLRHAIADTEGRGIGSRGVVLDLRDLVGDGVGEQFGFHLGDGIEEANDRAVARLVVLQDRRDLLALLG